MISETVSVIRSVTEYVATNSLFWCFPFTMADHYPADVYINGFR